MSNVQIKIRVDSNTTVNLALKEEMTAIEFFGIVKKAKAIFNVSNTELVSAEEPEEKPVKERISKPRQVHGKRKFTKWTEEMIEFFKDNYGKMPTSELARCPEMKGVSVQSLYCHACDMKLTKPVVKQ